MGRGAGGKMPQKHDTLAKTGWHDGKRLVLLKWYMCDGVTLKEYSIHIESKAGKLSGGWYTRESLAKARQLFRERRAKAGW